MRIPQKVTRLGTFTLWMLPAFFLADSLRTGSAQKEHFFAIGVSCAAWLLLSYWEWVRTQGYLDLDPKTKQLIIKKINFFGKSHYTRYRVQDFRAVSSFITWPENRINYVELITHTGGEGLIVAEFEPARIDKSFWGAPSYGESIQAQDLRQLLSTDFELEDRGFEGSRFPRKEYSPQPKSDNPM
ncbi:hypothetical protein [Rhodoferax mekongensis]|uniref:hypothetical protein n=1 Tax=Rhodoferax mekongensis TaxID=3068341 RepID=UPI0028BD8203|nr:hypothetical protein [Rhodoferax sp. TBRC 17199]MDT7514525.1 hypothetical protein [Rhodoferax sp. TBRC 17199]